MRTTLPSALRKTFPIVQEAVVWVNRQVGAYYAALPEAERAYRSIPISAVQAGEYLDAMALTGDVAATKQAARRYCQAWKQIKAEGFTERNFFKQTFHP